MNRILERNHVVVSSSNEYRDVLYVMTKTFRIQNNYALNQSLMYAKKHQCHLKILVVEPFEINQRNLDFFHQYLDDLLKNLKQVTEDVSYIQRDDHIEDHLKQVHTIFIDQAYLKFDIDFFRILKKYALDTDTILIEIESNVFVPVLVASDKEEYAARTIRPKIHRLLNDFSAMVLQDASLTKAEKEAYDVLNRFIEERLDDYDLHNDPSKHLTSNLSVYLKYGFISPISIYHRLKHRNDEQTKSFLEELIVRRELAYNYVYYNKGYDTFETMTDDWAYQTMKHHLSDERSYIYSKEDYLNFKTHDPYFNAAMKEMVYLGKMHSYMRMYWCKKIVEWTRTYKEAYDIAIDLNNTYFYDGLTPNGYTGVAWCFGKHDRAWFEREVFGKLRYMNANGLKRKFDIDQYVEEMNLIERDELK
jgi:deoxyribodipyrimidine photo-lyase